MKRMTFGETLASKIKAAQNSILTNGLKTVFGTGRIKTTGRPLQRRKPDLIKTNEG